MDDQRDYAEEEYNRRLAEEERYAEEECDRQLTEAEYDELYADVCQPIGCDNGHHLPWCIHLETDSE